MAQKTHRRIQTLAPRLQTINTSRVQPSGVERKRGRAGMVDRQRIRFRDGHLCQACSEQGRLTLGTQVDHIIPLHKGGPDTDDNKRLLCDECHAAKTREDLGQSRKPMIGLDGWPIE